MINIGEISKPSVSESPVKPRRALQDSELVAATESIDATSKVSAQLQHKNNKKAKNKFAQKNEDSAAEETPANSMDGNLSLSDLKAFEEDTIYDEKGHQKHHSELDVKA